MTLVLAVTPAVAQTAQGAQARPEFRRPAYHFLRQNENWSDLAGRPTDQTGDPWDRIKHIPLAADGEVWIGFGGHVQLRLENWNGFGFAAPATKDDDTFLL